MGVEALTITEGNSVLRPETDQDWLDWVSATATRNFLLDDPILDWLKLHGEEAGFPQDKDLSGYDPRTDFSEFLFEKAKLFEYAVVAHLRTLADGWQVISEYGEARSLEKAEETFSAMQEGIPIIYQGVLRDADSRTYGIPDLLIRSDALRQFFPDALSERDAFQPAPDLGDVSWHYRVVDIKFTTLRLLAGGELGNSGSAPAYKGQLYIYNRALGRLQGHLPTISYLLGRGWEQQLKGTKYRGGSCMERLGPVPQNSWLGRDGPLLAQAVEDACHWIRRVRHEGKNWVVFPAPSVPELYPNMGHTEDSSFSTAKKEIANSLGELTLLWYVGVSKRHDAHALGIRRWTDPNCTATSIGITGPKTQPTLQAILNINHTNDGPNVAPARVSACEEIWRKEPPLEFYVDFETVSDLEDDFSQIPNKGGEPLIFMIGCGHVEEGEWRFKCFIADALAEKCEERIIDQWLVHMEEVRLRLAPELERPLLIHWSPAESITIETAYNSAIERHPHRREEWSTPNWFDFLNKVIKAEPVVVRGALAFGLKKVGQAMHNNGLIQTSWEDSPLDGLGAMVGAWRSAAEAAERGVPLAEIDLMQGIRDYNEVDCKVMMEIVKYLRSNH